MQRDANHLGRVNDCLGHEIAELAGLKLDFLSDSHTVFGDARRAERLVQHAAYRISQGCRIILRNSVETPSRQLGQISSISSGC